MIKRAHHCGDSSRKESAPIPAIANDFSDQTGISQRLMSSRRDRGALHDALKTH